MHRLQSFPSLKRLGILKPAESGSRGRLPHAPAGAAICGDNSHKHPRRAEKLFACCSPRPGNMSLSGSDGHQGAMWRRGSSPPTQGLAPSTINHS